MRQFNPSDIKRCQQPSTRIFLPYEWHNRLRVVLAKLGVSQQFALFPVICAEIERLERLERLQRETDADKAS